MGYIDSYKRLEKLCGDVLDNDRRVSAYIDEMIGIKNGSYYVETWEEDLRKLKHYRWVRNKISHEPNCTEENMCNPEDEKWINAFYSRIMNQTDPLSLYRKAIRPKPRKVYSPTETKGLTQPQKNSQDFSGCASAFIWILIIAFLIMMLIVYLCN